MQNGAQARQLSPLRFYAWSVVTVALSYGIRPLLHRHSIYTEKLASRGHDIPATLQANFYHLKKMRDLMDARVVVLSAGGSMEDFSQTVPEHPEVSVFLVENQDGVVGFLNRHSVLQPPRQPEKQITLADLAHRRFIMVGADMPLLDVMIHLRTTNASIAFVTEDSNKATGSTVRGVITKERITNAMIDGMELF
jgi:predicted transcriptional regulator